LNGVVKNAIARANHPSAGCGIPDSFAIITIGSHGSRKSSVPTRDRRRAAEAWYQR
jgi:hypothetical protein